VSILDIILEYVLENRWKDYKRFSRTLADRIMARHPTTTKEVTRAIETMNHPFFAFNEVRKKDFVKRFPSRELLFQSHRARPDLARSRPKSAHKRKGIGKRLRFLILQRDGFRCKLCGKSAKETKLEVDHIIPIAKGGADSLDNLQTLCVDCNRGKSDLTAELPS
jgi:predicted restriction endonuclease